MNVERADYVVQFSWSGDRWEDHYSGYDYSDQADARAYMNQRRQFWVEFGDGPEYWRYVRRVEEVMDYA